MKSLHHFTRAKMMQDDGDDNADGYMVPICYADDTKREKIKLILQELKQKKKKKKKKKKKWIYYLTINSDRV